MEKEIFYPQHIIFLNYQLYFSWACVLCFLMVYHIDETVDIRGIFRHEQENRLLQYIVLC